MSIGEVMVVRGRTSLLLRTLIRVKQKCAERREILHLYLSDVIPGCLIRGRSLSALGSHSDAPGLGAPLLAYRGPVERNPDEVTNLAKGFGGVLAQRGILEEDLSHRLVMGTSIPSRRSSHLSPGQMRTTVLGCKSLASFTVLGISTRSGALSSASQDRHGTPASLGCSPPSRPLSRRRVTNCRLVSRWQVRAGQ